MMNQLTTKFLLAMLSMVGVNAFAYDIEVKNADGTTICYNYIADGNGLEVTHGENQYKGNVVIPESVDYNGKKYIVTSIGIEAFKECNELVSVAIPNSVTSIDENSFYGCESLASVTFGNSVKSIRSYAFQACISLTSVNIPSSVAFIGREAFRDCVGLNAVNITDLSAWCSIKYEREGNPLGWARHLYLNGEEVKDLVIPDDVTIVSDYAFESCESLTSVTIPSNVIELGSNAFYGCYNLTSVSIPNSMTSIGESVFSCSGLTSVTIPNSVTTIGNKAFYRCSELTSVTIPNSVTKIGKQAFEDCLCLSSLTIPGSVKYIGESAFSECSALSSLTLCEGVEKIGNSAFFYCTNLKSVEFPNSVTYIGDGAFSACRLTSVTFSNRLEYVGANAFTSYMAVYISDLAAWCSINFGEGGNPLSMHGLLLLNNELIKDLVIPSNVTKIGERAFQKLTGITSVSISGSVTSIGSNAFEGCTGLTSLNIPNNVTSIGSSAFEGCKGLTSLTIDNGVSTIEKRAFYGCIGLNSVILPNSITSIGYDAFAGVALSIVVSLIQSPTANKSGMFSEKTYKNATLYVPVGTKRLYETRKGWSSFYNIVEGAEEYVGIASVCTNDVQIQSNGSTLIISGVEAGKTINVYDVAGRLVGSASASVGATSFDTSLHSGEIGIVKIDKNTIKVVVR